MTQVDHFLHLSSIRHDHDEKPSLHALDGRFGLYRSLGLLMRSLQLAINRVQVVY